MWTCYEGSPASVFLDEFHTLGEIKTGQNMMF